MLKVGSRVQYIRADTTDDIATGYYPPIGTLGTVMFVSLIDNDIEVKWDCGTKGDGVWWCNHTDVQEISEAM